MTRIVERFGDVCIALTDSRERMDRSQFSVDRCACRPRRCKAFACCLMSIPRGALIRCLTGKPPGSSAAEGPAHDRFHGRGMDSFALSVHPDDRRRPHVVASDGALVRGGRGVVAFGHFRVENGTTRRTCMSAADIHFEGVFITDRSTVHPVAIFHAEVFTESTCFVVFPCALM